MIIFFGIISLMRKELSHVLNKVESEIVKVTKLVRLTRADANALSQSAITSMSAAGDRYHAEKNAEVNKIRLENLIKLKVELEAGVEKEKPEVVEAPCAVCVKVNGGDDCYIFVQNTVNMEGIKFVSPDSLIGKEIAGKKVGGKFTAKLQNGQVAGQIMEIN